MSLTDTAFDIYARTSGVILCYLSTSEVRNRNVWDLLTISYELKGEYSIDKETLVVG